MNPHGKPYVLFDEQEVEAVFAGKNILPYFGESLSRASGEHIAKPMPRDWKLTDTISVNLDADHIDAAKRKLRELVAADETYGFGILRAELEHVELGAFLRL